MRQIPKSEIETLTEAFAKDGSHFDAGCDESDVEKYRAKCHELMPSKHVCIVKNWTWWDIETSEQDQNHFNSNSLYPALIKADCVIEDEACRFANGDWVRTSYLVNFSDNCIFETNNTVYLLVGSGNRKTVELDAAMSFF
ncbi:hypothetical protein D5R81_04805 [Parashewanella spongiae]|uniref:DUF6957 domain-containing protein n=1 Tax=Parashewanella spongiae TaxID=342950 RepID=A0A3A6TR69_9GAMM|nr:hypothetical protein [Parashewanella spongiae]MCL1077284.1 hypothetical protein [Parashewanella spongiae]RJY18537.1 hypothetical protein D5R81_04805 [Parashewanella spongiae]